MKYKVALLIFMLSFLGYSQTKSNISIGVKGGGNLSSFSDFEINGRTLTDYQSKIGFYVGVYTNIVLNNKFRFQPELQFALQGARSVIDNVQVADSSGNPIGFLQQIERNINESTVLLPLVFQYYPTDEFYVEVGPQFGYIIHAKFKYTSDTRDALDFLGLPSDDVDIDNFDELDIGLTIGIGYKLLQKLSINARYFFSLNERNDSIKSSIFNLGLEFKVL